MEVFLYINRLLDGGQDWKALIKTLELQGYWESGLSGLDIKALTQNVRPGFEFHLVPILPSDWMFE